MDFRALGNSRLTNDPLQQDLLESFASGRVSRRNFMKRGAMLGLSTTFMGAFIAACGSSSKSSTATTAAPAATTTAAAGSTATTTAGSTAGTTAASTASTTAGAALKQGGTMRIAAQKPGSPLDPVAMDNLGTYTVVTQSFEYLCGKGENAALAPALALSWAPNADGSEWTFNLRTDVTWHDGTPFTSADVVASMDRLAASNLKAYLVKGAVTAVDAHTVSMKLLNADGQFPYQVSLWNPQSLITPASFVLGSTLDKTPTGTGPFKLDKYDVATGASFSANANWWGGKPLLDKVEFIFSDDIATQISGLQGDAADAIVQFSVVGGDALFADPNIVVESIRGSAHRQIWMDTREGDFTDVRVRQAIALGLDRKALIDNVLQGKGDLGNDHPIAPVYAFWDSTQAQRTRDVAAAKKLLADAGKSNLSVTMYVPKLQEIPQLAELVQTQLKDIGVQITLNVESTDTFYDEWCKTYTPICDGGKSFGIVDYGSRGVPDVYLVKAYATGEWNSAHYVSEPFNAAVKAYQAALDEAARKAPIADIQKIANTDVPYAIPYFYNSLYAHSKKVGGIIASGLGHFELGKAGFVA